MTIEDNYRKKLEYRKVKQAHAWLGVDRPRPQPPQQQEEPAPQPDLLKMARDMMLQMSRGQQPSGN